VRRSLRKQLLISYLAILALFTSGVILTLFTIGEVGERTRLLVDRFWQDSSLIAQVHTLLSEVALFVNLSPENPATAPAQSELHANIDRLITQIASSSFREDFRTQQVEQLSQLKASLAGPIEVLASLERQNQAADAALTPLLEEAARLGRRDLIRDLTIAALAYRDYYITANPSDLEIFRRQIERLDQHPLSPGYARQFALFRASGEAVFMRRMELRSSREQVIAQIRVLSDSLRNRTELYVQRVIFPLREEINTGLALIPNILMGAVIISGLVALGAALLLARRISVPMERAAVALRRIEQGDLAARIEGAGSDEIDTLGRTINSLAISLSQTLDDLRTTVGRLRESEEGYRQIAEQRLDLERIINASPTLAFLCRIDNGLPVQFVSASLAQFGYRPADLLEQRTSILQLIHPADRPRVEGVIAAHVNNRDSTDFFQEFRIQSQHGEVRWVDCRMLVQRDAQGVATHLQGVLLDITEKIRLREQAAQASRLASLGELAAGVAHEINNPNATILLNAAVLKELGEGMLRLLDERWREQGELELGRLPYARLRSEIPRLQAEVLEAAGRIRRIVDDLKEFSGAEPPEFRQLLELNAVVQAAVRLTGNALKKATDAFTAEYAADLPLLKGHVQRLEQVVVNLLMNACQALPDRQRGITVRTGRLPAEAALYIEVGDQGQGIAAADLPHVTDPFFTTRRDSGGTGLGLSISARIVKEHGGRLEIISTPTRGTTVRVILPLADEEKV
jgi:PAS domain S-box-containing protein